MRNLKRALSLALASVMLLGMMVVGSSATSINDFTDADEITQQEAVALTTGLGIFDGYDTGDFKPENVVTRAEMAVIIAKILHGVDVDPSNFVGAGKFTDVPEWAEGYVNLCASLGIIVGVGDNKFAPNQTVTTAEASTMLLKALGYYTDPATELGEDWQLEVTSKATQLGLYGDLTLNMNQGLTRENVAVLTMNALFAQLVAYDNNRVLYVKANDRNVVVTAGTKDELNTLAYSTFGLYSVEGVVTANGQTTKALSASLKSAAQTTVMFTDDVDLDKDGKNEYGENDTYNFEVSTDLSMIGRAVKVYYKIEKKAPVVYALVDESTLYAVIDYNKNTTTLAEAANDAGFKKNSILDIGEDNYSVNYDLSSNLKDLAANKEAWSTGTTITSSVGAKDGITHYNIGDKKLVVVSNSSNKEVEYVIVLDQYLDTVAQVDEDTTPVDYSFKTNTGDLNIVTSAVAEDDYVIVTNIGLQGKVLVAAPATILSADVTKISGISDDDASAKTIVADGVTYAESKINPNIANLDLVTAFFDVKTLGTSSLILDQYGDLIGTAGEKSTPNYAYVAQYGVIHSTGSLNTTNALTAHIYFTDGTDGIYEVASFSNLTNAPVNVTNMTDAEAAYVNLDEKLNADKTTVNDANGQDFKTGALGIWNVTINSSGKAVIKAATTTEETDNGADGAALVGTRLVKGHSTFVDASGNAVYGVSQDAWVLTNGHVTTIGGVGAKAKQFNPNSDPDIKVNSTLYQNNDTVYFYVDGLYGHGQTVEVITGVKNVVGFENSSDATKVHGTYANGTVTAGTTTTGIAQVFATAGTTAAARNTVGAVLVEGVETGTSNVYYYNMGNYHYSADGVTYELYDMDGNLVEITYPNQTKKNAESLYDGFYLAKSNKLVALDNVTGKKAGVAITTAQSDSSDSYVWAKKGNTAYYIINDTAEYDEYVDNLYTKNDTVGTIAEDVKVVDACGSGINSLSKLVRILKNNTGDVKIAYYFSTEDYEANVIFISDYEPDATEAPGSSTATTYQFLNSLEANRGNDNKVTVTGTIYMNNDDTQPLKQSNDNKTVVKAVYTITATSSAGVVKTYTYTDTTGTITSGVFNGTIPTFRATNGSTWAYDVDVVVTFTLGGSTVTVGGSGVII